MKADESNLAALLQLGICHTNEFSRERAFAFLEQWLSFHPKYRSVLERVQLPPNMRIADKLEAYFVSALQINESDVNLHTVLGVLYNASKQFEKAEEAFRYATQLAPSDYSLWNKLGATMANSEREDGCKDAVLAYRKALTIKPNYVRSWTNMGIAYTNQGLFKLSCKYFLKAISLKSSNSEHIWEYLRYCFLHMEDKKLMLLSEKQDVELFRPYFKF